MNDSGNPHTGTATRDRLLHEFNNHLSVIIGFCDLLLNDLPADDPKRADVLEMRKAGDAARALLPKFSNRSHEAGD